MSHLLRRSTTRAAFALAALAALAALSGPTIAQGAPAPGHRLLGPATGTETHLVDADGTIIHSWPSPHRGIASYILDDGSLLRTIATYPPGTSLPGGATGGVQRVAFDGTVLWDFRYDSGGVQLHHDVAYLPSGNVLLIAWEDLTVAEAVAAGRDPALIEGDVFRPDHLIEVRPSGPTSGDVVWEWHFMDHVIQDHDPTKANFGIVADHPELLDLNYPPIAAQADDWNHMNAVEYDAEHDRIFLTSRHQHEIWVIDHSTTTAEAAGHTGGSSGRGGDLLYRWGNPAAYRAGTPADQQLFGPHAPTLIPEGYPSLGGDLLVYNNNHPAGTAVWELDLPLDAAGDFIPGPGGVFGPPGPAWSYSAPGFHGGFASNGARLPNGNTLISSATLQEVIEVTPGGQIVWSYALGAAMFHAHYVERSLWSDRTTLSVSTGGSVRFDLVAGSPRAGEMYLVLGSISGTSPGLPVGPHHLPLNPDIYTDYTANHPNTRVLTRTFDALQPLGREKAFLNLPPLPGAIIGLTAHHAFVTLDAGATMLTSASNAVAVTFVP